MLRDLLLEANVLGIRFFTPRRCDFLFVLASSLGANLFSSLIAGAAGPYVGMFAVLGLLIGFFAFLLGALIGDTYDTVVRLQAFLESQGTFHSLSVLVREKLASRSNAKLLLIVLVLSAILVLNACFVFVFVAWLFSDSGAECLNKIFNSK